MTKLSVVSTRDRRGSKGKGTQKTGEITRNVHNHPVSLIPFFVPAAPAAGAGGAEADADAAGTAAADRLLRDPLTVPAAASDSEMVPGRCDRPFKI